MLALWYTRATGPWYLRSPARPSLSTGVMQAPAPSIKKPAAPGAKVDNVDTVPAPIAHKRKPFNRANVNATLWTPFTQVCI